MIRIGPVAMAMAAMLLAACGRVAPTSPPATSPATVSPSDTSDAGIQFIDVGGYDLAIRCEGSGSPTVVFEAGLGGDMDSFWRVAADVQETTRICSYDRAGIGSSDQRPASASPSSAGAVADELDRLLAGAGVTGPVVIVGHSFGGAVEQLYADRHMDNVAGLVFVDPVIAGTALWFGRTWEDGYSAVDMRRTKDELERMGSYGSVPTFVLTQGFAGADSEVPQDFRREWTRGHELLAARSSDAIHLIAFDSSHGIPDDEPDLVLAVIEEVLQAVQTGEPLAACDVRFKPLGGACA